MTPTEAHGNYGSSHPPTNANQINVVAILAALRRWWKVSVPIGLILSVSGAAIVYALFEPAFKSTAWFRLRPELIVSPKARGQENPEVFFNNQLEAIRSPLVLDRVLKQSEVATLTEIREANDPLAYLRKRLAIRRVGRSDLLTLEFEAASPESSKQILSAVTREYLAFHGSAEQSDRESKLKAYRDRYERQARDVRTKFDNVKSLAKIAAVKDPFAARIEQSRSKEETPASRTLAGLNELLTDTIISREIEEVKLHTWTAVIEDQDLTPPETVIEQLVARDGQLAAMHAELEDMLERHAAIKETAVDAEKHPNHQRLAEDIEKHKTLIEEKKLRIRETARSEVLVARTRGNSDALTQIEQRIRELKIREEILRDRLRSETAQAEEVVGDLLELQLARDEYERSNKVLAFFASAIEDLEDFGMSPGERVRLELPPNLPTAPIETFPWKKMGMVATGLFAFPFGLAVAWELLVKRVNGREELERQTGLSVVGEIPDFTRLTAKDQDSRHFGPYEESINSLRTQLLLSHGLRDLQLLSVASSVSGEGKTSVAAKLAISIVRASHERTLLIDSDIRRPDVHRLFDLNYSPGLGDVLADKARLEDVIVHDPETGLDILPAGNLCSNPHLLMAKSRLEPLFAELRGRYPHIVVDTPPVLQASESLNVHALTDGCLICTMRDVTRVDRFQFAYRRLLSAGARPIGIVLSGVSWMQYANRYGGYGYYSSSHPDAVN